eukprot:15464270-Alexandrium_andersonii.AAC.1
MPLLQGRRVVPSEGTEKGVRYLSADGGRIRNRGEVSLGRIAKERHRCRLTFQVAKAKRLLLAARALAHGGNDVRFTAG